VVVALAHVNVLALAHHVKCRCWKLLCRLAWVCFLERIIRSGWNVRDRFLRY
jgi:hypothetical protein